MAAPRSPPEPIDLAKQSPFRDTKQGVVQNDIYPIVLRENATAGFYKKYIILYEGSEVPDVTRNIATASCDVLDGTVNVDDFGNDSPHAK